MLMVLLFFSLGSTLNRKSCHTLGSLNNSVVLTVIFLTVFSRNAASFCNRLSNLGMSMRLSSITFCILLFRLFSEYSLKSYSEWFFMVEIKYWISVSDNPMQQS